jgi:hypothetical protein
MDSFASALPLGQARDAAMKRFPTMCLKNRPERP